MGINSQTEECKAGSVNLPHLSTDKLPVSVQYSEIQGQRDPAERPQDPPPESFLPFLLANLDNPPCRVRRAKLPNVLCPHYFDFTTGDMDTIRTWWCLLLLSGNSVVRFSQKRKYEDQFVRITF
ncbi:hypothetical protein PFLUV_G00079310 [Perca fluviatilis]|uniref:Uncharacterized protein n=1 Tax=Perca fluviatilis TaxID=8168 RepID=A0A6A5FCZ8_PERFL|nr:hypothetical protein PFLUV_G00079310 [Perca fluviatilis]